MFSAGLLFSLMFFSSTSVESSICNLPLKPVIVIPVNNATVSTNSILIKGTALAGSSVTLQNNTSPVATLVVDQSGEFAVEATLDDGANLITSYATTSCGSASGDTVKVTVNHTPIVANPSISNSSTNASVSSSMHANDSVVTSGSDISKPATSSGGPQDSVSSAQAAFDALVGLTVSRLSSASLNGGDSTFVSGTTLVPTKFNILVNGRQVARIDQAATSFKVSVPVNSGKNIILVQAYTDAGQTNQLLVFNNDITQSWYETPIGHIVIGVMAASSIFGVIVLVRVV